MDIIRETCKILKIVLQARAPYDTGNLALNSIRISKNAVIIGGAEIAPYAPITNAPWVSEKWKGRKNPNEGWVYKAIEEARPIIQRTLSGHADEEDVRKALKYYKGVRTKRQRTHAALLKKKQENINGAKEL